MRPREKQACCTCGKVFELTPLEVLDRRETGYSPPECLACQRGLTPAARRPTRPVPPPTGPPPPADPWELWCPGCQIVNDQRGRCGICGGQLITASPDVLNDLTGHYRSAPCPEVGDWRTHHEHAAPPCGLCNGVGIRRQDGEPL